jgi:hypothetical protein
MKLLTTLLVVSLPVLADCNRDCLRGFLTQYLDAMVAQNPGALAVSPKARFTEDGDVKKLGEGVWKSTTKLTPYRYDVLDVRRGVGIAQVVLEENGSPTMFSVRLKVAGKKITEIETQITRSKEDGRIFAIEALKTASAAMLMEPAATARMRRADMEKIALLYPAGLKIGDFVKSDTPFAADGYRLENGLITAGKGCSREGCADMKKQKIIAHPAITARVAAVDEEMGIVLLRMNFGDTGSYGPGNALHVWEAFKVYGGEIHAVEAFMKVMPASKASGWD